MLSEVTELPSRSFERIFLGPSTILLSCCQLQTYLGEPPTADTVKE